LFISNSGTRSNMHQEEGELLTLKREMMVQIEQELEMNTEIN